MLGGVVEFSATFDVEFGVVARPSFIGRVYLEVIDSTDVFTKAVHGPMEVVGRTMVFYAEVEPTSKEGRCTTRER